MSKMRLKENKIYPGEWRIINALHSKGPSTFTELTTKARINRVTLSEYLKHLKRRRIIEHDKATGKYSFPLTFQPLLESSFPDKEFLETISGLIETARVAKKVWGSQNMQPDKFLFKFLLHALKLELNLALTEASCYENMSAAREYVSRFSERHLIPRLQLLLIEGFEDRQAFQEFMKENLENLIQEVKELTESWKRVRKKELSAGSAEESSHY